MLYAGLLAQRGVLADEEPRADRSVKERPFQGRVATSIQQRPSGPEYRFGTLLASRVIRH